MKQLLGQVNEHATQIEMAKVQAIGTRNMVSAEVESRAKKLYDQKDLIIDKQEQLEVIFPVRDLRLLMCRKLEIGSFSLI